MNVDDVISYYVGKVVADKVHIQRHLGIKDGLKGLERDELVLAALKCAKAIGFTGEENSNSREY